MTPQISSFTSKNDKIFGFVLHTDMELPKVPLVYSYTVDRKQIETLRDQLNEVLEWDE